jgi:hypothetical protein
MRRPEQDRTLGPLPTLRYLMLVNIHFQSQTGRLRRQHAEGCGPYPGAFAEVEGTECHPSLPEATCSGEDVRPDQVSKRASVIHTDVIP